MTAAGINAFNRTFHPDEANQAITTGRLLETGAYTYNPQDHHGPTLYYAAAAIQKAAGRNSAAELDANLLRCTPLLFAALALVFGFLAVRKITKRTGLGLLFALLLGTSPIFVFFATDFIQEMLLASFTMMMLWSAIGYQHSTQPLTVKIKPGTWALLFGIAAGLAFATKETAVLTFAAAAISSLFVFITQKYKLPTTNHQLPTTNYQLPTILAIAGFTLTSILLYSSFASNWQGVYNAFIAAPLSYIHRAAGSAASQGAAAHVHPWWQYLKWMFADAHGSLLFFVLCGTAGGLFARIVPLRMRPQARAMVHAPLLRAFTFLLAYSLLLLALYSLIPYKTPWCALQIETALLLSAFLGFAVFADVYVAVNSLILPSWWPVQLKSVCGILRKHPRTLRLAGAIPLIVIASLLLGANIQDLIRLNRDPDSKDIPFNYASASPQAKDLAALIIDKIASSPKPATNSKLQTLNSFVAVALPPEDTWPLPFYLRTVKDKVGYWTQFGELEALAGLGRKPTVVVVPAEEGHLVQPLFPHLKNTKRFEMRPRVRVRAFW